MIAGFLGGGSAALSAAPRKGRRTVGFRLGPRTSLGPSSPCALQPAVPSAGGGSDAASPRLPRAGCRNLDRLSIALATRLRLRARLTPGRRALPGKPWPCGGGETLPPYRYLYLHLLFRKLQRGSPPAFHAGGMLPYRSIWIPRLRPAAYTRLLSMRARSTSELLRTLQMDGCFQANILAVWAGPPRLANSAASSGPWAAVWILLLSDADLSTRALTPPLRAAAFGVRQDLTGGEALASYR